MMREVEQSKKREAESKKRCAELEESLEKKMKEVQENERKLVGHCDNWRCSCYYERSMFYLQIRGSEGVAMYLGCLVVFGILRTFCMI
uniref:OTU domain-containing protein n=1 Tax=Parascaris univalens TaxID=6257 RepID=A0A915BGF5_PARUN